MIPPLTKWINDIKVKLGFSRTMTAAGADVVDAVNKHSDQIVNLGNALAYVINGNTYSGTTIPSGSYVLWNGVLYTANGAIPAGSVSASNFSSLPATGGLNAIANNLKPVSNSVTVNSIITTNNFKEVWAGKIGMVYGYGRILNGVTLVKNDVLFTLSKSCYSDGNIIMAKTRSNDFIGVLVINNNQVVVDSDSITIPNGTWFFITPTPMMAN